MSNTNRQNFHELPLTPNFMIARFLECIPPHNCFMPHWRKRRCFWTCKAFGHMTITFIDKWYYCAGNRLRRTVFQSSVAVKAFFSCLLHVSACLPTVKQVHSVCYRRTLNSLFLQRLGIFAQDSHESKCLLAWGNQFLEAILMLRFKTICTHSFSSVHIYTEIVCAISMPNDFHKFTPYR